MLVYCKWCSSLSKRIHVGISKLVLRLSNNKFALRLVELILGNLQVELKMKDVRTK